MVDALLFCHCIFCLSLMLKSPLTFEGPPLTRGSINRGRQLGSLVLGHYIF